MTVIGFDFGTTNSLISVIRGDRAIDILDPNNSLPFPSVVRYEGESVIVGREAKESLDEAGLGVHGNTVLSPKFFLGEEAINIGGVDRSPIDVVADIVRFVKNEAIHGDHASSLDGVQRAVVTIPVNMNGPRRAALREAFSKADISIVQFVHEPLAALYGFLRGCSDPESRVRELNRRNVLVVDWGGGTLDLTLCRVGDGRVTQLLNSGTDEVGGDQFDDAIRNEILRRFVQETHVGSQTEIRADANRALRYRCERAKIDLSTRSSATVYQPGLFRNPDTDLEYLLTREVLDELTTGLVRNGMNRITTLLNDAEVSTSQVAMVLVTGGMASMPAISARLNEMFGQIRVEVPPDSATLIARGAAWIAHDKRTLHLAKPIEIELARQDFLTVIAAGTPMPTDRGTFTKPVDLYCVDPRDGMAKIQFRTPLGHGVNTQIGEPRKPLGGLAVEVDRSALPFVERLRLDLEIDDDLILYATVHSLNHDGRARTAFYELEFSLPINTSVQPRGERADAGPFEPPAGPARQRGQIAIRSNISDRIDKRRVPGELLYTYDRAYFGRAQDPPPDQDWERLYYQPCAVCKRRSGDPDCRCGSTQSD